MRSLMGYSTTAFLTVKCGLTALSLLFLGLHKYFRRVRTVLLSVFGLYALLLVYHLYLANLR